MIAGDSAVITEEMIVIQRNASAKLHCWATRASPDEDGTSRWWNRGRSSIDQGACSPGPHCHSTLPLPTIACHAFGMYRLILLSSLSLAVTMTSVAPRG